MSKLARFLLKHAAIVTTIGFILGGIGTYYSVHLFMNLRTEIEELLPTDARSVLDLDEVKSRLESINNLCVLVFSNNIQGSKQFVIDFAQEIEKLPKDTVESVEYRIDKELKFFKERQSLFIEENDLDRIERFIKDKIEYETQLYNPLTIIENKSFVEPRLDFMALRKKYTSRTDSYTRFKDGFYATPDERIRVILVNLPGNAGGMSGSERLRKSVDQVLAKMDRSKYAPDLRVEFTGGVQDMIEEHDALVEDLLLSTVIVTVLVGLAMIIYFRTLVGTFALIAALFIGTFCTFGVSYFLVGYLNANSAFMGSIVIGNGINFGIILLARFMEERRHKKSTPRSIAKAIDKTLPGTIVAAAAAGLSYGSLMLTSFRGFRQFGVIGFTGMVLCWIATYTVLPSLIICLYKIGLLRKAPPKYTPWFSNLISLMVKKFPKPILVLTLVLSIFSIHSLTKINSTIIETDLKKLRNKKSMENGSMYWGKFQDEVFQRYLTPIVILPKEKSEVQPIADEVRKVQKQEGKNTFIVNVSTIDDFVPKDQKLKVETLKKIEGMLTRRVMYQLSPAQKQMTKELLSPDSRHPFTKDELPEMVRSKFRERSGAIGNLVLVEPSLSPDLAQSNNLIHFVHSIREAADKIHPGVAVAGTLPVTADMFESIVKDGPKATLFAFIAVLLLIILLFRNTVTIAQCSFALILGVLWLFGFILGFHQKINFLNFIALPITFGIGVDYGVNIFQRYRLEKGAGILVVLRQTGGAVMLASLTTIIGYGSLIIASNQAFVSFGKLAIIGELTCVFAAVVSLPAFIWYREQKSQIKNETKTHS